MAIRHPVRLLLPFSLGFCSVELGTSTDSLVKNDYDWTIDDGATSFQSEGR